MSINCALPQSGGKGNLGMFIERSPRVCAAGVVSAQPGDSVARCLKQYLLQDEVDALIGDSIKPDPKPTRLPPLRRPIPRDMRNAGMFGEGPELINPPTKTKFQSLVEDFKCTVYKSYWHKPVGKVRDPAPMFPKDFDVNGTTFGKKEPYCGRLYDIVMPEIPIPDKTRKHKEVSYQVDRNYCRPAFDPNRVYGKPVHVDPRGKFAKCCLTDDRVMMGTSLKTPMNTLQVNFLEATQPKLGTYLKPNNNIKNVPKGHAFGFLKAPDSLSVPQCLTTCEINPEKDFFKECLAHLNTLRKFLKKRYESNIFKHLMLGLKRYDECRSGWLPKEIVYDVCTKRQIRFNPNLIEPLLCLWQAFDGTNIEYKTFVLAINFTIPSPELPRVWDIPDDCIDFRTTYSEMVKPDQRQDTRLRAGLPSGRYFDLDYPVTPNDCCKAARAYLPQETDAKACLSQSILTALGVSHRDMFAKRDKETVKRVFELAGESFSDDSFDKIWENAQKYHSQGCVCFETFRKSLEEMKTNT